MNLKPTSICCIMLLMLVTACGDDDKQTAANGKNKAESSEISSPTKSDLEIVAKAAEGDVQAVKKLLESKAASVDSTDEFAVNPLIAAVSNGRRETVELLLDYIKQKDSKLLDHADSEGKTALYYAVEFVQPELIILLRKHGANPNKADKNGVAPLHKAVIMADLLLIDCLLADSPDAVVSQINVLAKDGRTALMLAANNGNKEVVESLIKHGADAELADAKGLTALMLAVENNNKDMVAYLLQAGVNVNTLTAQGKTALMLALEKNNSDMARHLLIKAADPNIFGGKNLSALEIAVDHDYADVVLVKAIMARLKKDEVGKLKVADRALSKALHKGNYDVVEALIEAGGDIKNLETDNSNGLIKALENDEREIALMMAKQGAEVNKLNAEGMSPLALAVQKNFIEVAELLVAKGAEVEPKVKNEQSAPLAMIFQNDNAPFLDVILANSRKLDLNQLLLRAVTEARPKLLVVLLKRGANPNIADREGKPAIWQAVAKNNLEAVRILAEASAELNVRDAKKGATPLMIAVAAKSKDIVEYLLSQNADPNILDAEGLSAIAYAILTYQPKLVEILAQSGASLEVKDNNGHSLYFVVENSQLNSAQKQKMLDLLKFLGAAS